MTELVLNSNSTLDKLQVPLVSFLRPGIEAI